MKTFTALFYYRSATGSLEEERRTAAAASKAAFTRTAKETARVNQWRLVDVWQVAPDQNL